MEKHSDGSEEQQRHLDENQYTMNGILRYEYIFGRGFISSGGLDTTEEILKKANLKVEKDGKILDVGCGIGGGTEYLAKYYQCHVHGIDLSQNVIQIAKERYSDNSNLTFDVADSVTVQLEPSSYDMLYSRDTILHLSMENKKAMFRSALSYLKPGGHVLVSDYCCGPEDKWTAEFEEYVKQRSYTLLELKDYASMLTELGFVNVVAEDITERWIQVLKEELRRLTESEADFLEQFSKKDLTDLSEGWKKKIVRAEAGIQKWGLVTAQKKN